MEGVDYKQLADTLEKLAGTMRRGELSASEGTIARLEGAAILAALLAAGPDVDPTVIVERLTAPRT